MCVNLYAHNFSSMHADLYTYVCMYVCMNVSIFDEMYEHGCVSVYLNIFLPRLDVFIKQIKMKLFPQTNQKDEVSPWRSD